MPNQKVRLVTESAAARQLLEAILRNHPRARWIELGAGSTTSSAIGIAQASLLNHPGSPVALVLDSETEDPEKIAELRGVVEGLLARAAVGPYHLALAIPRLDAWAKVDPRIKAVLEAEEHRTDDFVAQARLVLQLTAEQPFDLAALRQASHEFQALEAFIQQHTQPAQTRAKVSLF